MCPASLGFAVECSDTSMANGCESTYRLYASRWDDTAFIYFAALLVVIFDSRGLPGYGYFGSLKLSLNRSRAERNGNVSPRNIPVSFGTVSVI